MDSIDKSNELFETVADELRDRGWDVVGLDPHPQGGRQRTFVVTVDERYEIELNGLDDDCAGIVVDNERGGPTGQIDVEDASSAEQWTVAINNWITTYGE